MSPPQHTPHGLRRLFLSGTGDVRVSVQDKPYRDRLIALTQT